MKQKLFLADGTEVTEIWIWQNEDESMTVGVNSRPMIEAEEQNNKRRHGDGWLGGRTIDTFADVKIEILPGFDSDFNTPKVEVSESSNEKNG